jgi:acyl-CoA reductase-like NAD-dependent aldehyde dehydrogenase
MLAAAKVDGVTLTGSVAAGSRVAEIAGRGIKKVVLELGGSDPFIVLEDADLRLACEKAASARLLNSGQSCIAAKRFIVVKKAVKEFTEGFVAAAKALKVGDPLDKATDVGPLANREQLDKIISQVEDAKRKGAKVLCGGFRLDRKGYYYMPTILANASSSMKVLSEEVFGPVAPIIPVKGEKEAIRAANDTEYGLGGSVWTKDRERGERIARQVECGIIAVNSGPRSDPRLPFGGVKKSGIGRELSRYGLLEFVNMKSVKVF